MRRFTPCLIAYCELRRPSIGLQLPQPSVTPPCYPRGLDPAPRSQRPAGRLAGQPAAAAGAIRRLPAQPHQNTRHQNLAAETGSRNGRSSLQFRTQRPRQKPRNGAVPRHFQVFSNDTRGDSTGWLGRRDSNLCISKSDLLNFILAQPDLGVARSAARAHQFEMRKFESYALA